MKRSKHLLDRRKLGLRPRQAMAARAARLRKAIATEHGLLSDSETAIREDRDARRNGEDIDTATLDEAIGRAQELVRHYVPDDVSLVDELHAERRKDAAIASAEEEYERMAGSRLDFKEYLRRPVGLDELDMARDESIGREER